MKHPIHLLLAFIFLFFFSSCALMKEDFAPASAGSSHAQPEFLEGVAIQNGSNAVQIQKSRSVYRPQERRGIHIADQKITIDHLVETSDTALAAFIENWLGVPYRYGGMTKSGIDCSAFTQTLYSFVYHVDLLRTAFEQFHASLPIYDPEELEEGDLVFFKIRSRRISHVGVYLSDGYFVQASNHGVMISSLDNDYWKRYFYAGGRVRG